MQKRFCTLFNSYRTSFWGYYIPGAIRMPKKCFCFPIYPTNRLKRGVSKHFQAKLAWHWNSHNLQHYIADTNQTLHNIKDLQWVIPSMRETSPKWRTIANLKILNCYFLQLFKLPQQNMIRWCSGPIWPRLVHENYKLFSPRAACMPRHAYRVCSACVNLKNKHLRKKTHKLLDRFLANFHRMVLGNWS